MAATLQQHCTTNATAKTRPANATASPNPQLKRLVYSKYRELLGSYNEQANAYIDTLPTYMVHKDTGFNLELKTQTENNAKIASETYGSGQRMPTQQIYEAPACVQNAMMTKDKKPFTYTPGGIDLAQIKSERMAKRLARNAQAEGAIGVQQQNRPSQSQSPSNSSPSAVAAMGAAAMGMPFQVLPPPPSPGPGKNFNGGSTPAPPPPPPSSSSNFSNTGTLAPPINGNAGGGRGSTTNSPNMPRKSPTPQRFEPPPLGFRPEIKIPPNPMATLRKVPPPVEKNNFWKEEYVKERSKDPMVDAPTPANNNTNNNINQNDSVDSASSSQQITNANNNGTTPTNDDNIDGFKKTMPTTTTNASQQNQQTNNNHTNTQQPQQQEQQQMYTPPTPPQPQQSPIKSMEQSPQPSSPQQKQQSPVPQHTSQQQSTKSEFRSVAATTSPAVNIYARQTDSPKSVENATPPRAAESPFKFAQQQQQQRAPPAVSPLAQQSSPSSATSGPSVSPNSQAQTVPWRTQRGQTQQQQAQPVLAQSHPQPIYNNIPSQPQKSPDFSTIQSAYQASKPTNVGSLYIAPLAPSIEPQSQHIVRQQLQQQQQQRDSPVRQMTPHQQQPTQQLRWMSTQPIPKEQPAWARPEENGNVVPSSLNRIKSPPPPTPAILQQSQQQGNGIMPQTITQNFGAQPINSTGLRLQINTSSANPPTSQNGPKERIIPIQLEQTPTYTPAQPSFNTQQQQQYGGAPAPGYVMRTPNQFVDQGYNNFTQQQQQPQRITSPTLQQLNAPRMVQQTQNNVTGNKTYIVPITLEGNDGTRGPISKTPIVIQNDQRTPPIQSKSFRILQKITDTIDDGSNNDNANQQQQQLQQSIQQTEPQLQRPTFARQMSAQQAHHSPTVEQMRRMQIGHEQGKSTPTTPTTINYNLQHYFYDNTQQYIPPSEQQVPEPKIYTGSAIPSRSFKILQAMTQPENAEEQENYQNHNNEMNETESIPESNKTSYSNESSTAESVSSFSSSSIGSELAFSSLSSPTSPPSQPLPYPPYQYPYCYPWYPPPLPPPPLPTHLLNQNDEHSSTSTWHYSYGMHAKTSQPPHPPPSSIVGDQSAQTTPYHPYPYYYPYYPPPPPHALPPYPHQNNANSSSQVTEFDLQNMYALYVPPPTPYLAYPYPVAPGYCQNTNSRRASSVLPDIIITPSIEDINSQVIMKHQNKIQKEECPKRSGSIEIEASTSLKSDQADKDSVVDIKVQHLENMNKSIQNNLNSKRQTKKSYKKNIDQKSPEDNTSTVQISLITRESKKNSDIEKSSDSEVTPKQIQKNGPIRLQSIKSVNNVQIYNGKQIRNEEDDSDLEFESQSEENDNDDDETAADGESDIFDEEEEENYDQALKLEEHIEEETDSDSKEFIMDDNLSVIYEEDSEMEKSSDMSKTVIGGDKCSQGTNPPDDLVTEIEENDSNGDEDDDNNSDADREDSTSVTVRLPLKFSFTKSRDAENITTVEVGKSEIEQKRNSVPLNQKRNSFTVATVKNDSDEKCDDCDVSVTISLTPSSSKSSSLGAKIEHKNLDDLYPIGDMPLGEEGIEMINSSQEDVPASFSLNMRNKFANETINGDITNNIAMLKKAVKEPVTETSEEIDFFATLMATKMQAQKIKEQSANYWGKTMENKEQKKEEKTSEEESLLIQNESVSNHEQKEIDEEEMKARVDFWNKYSGKEAESKLEPKQIQIQDISNDNQTEVDEEIETEINFWEKYSNKPKTGSSIQITNCGNSELFTTDNKSYNLEQSVQLEIEKTTDYKAESQQIEDICADKTDDISIPTKSEIESKEFREIKEPKLSFWDNCPNANSEEKTMIEKTESKIEKTISSEPCPNTNFWERYSKTIQEENSLIEETLTQVKVTEKSEEIEDIWVQPAKEEVQEHKFSIWNEDTATNIPESLPVTYEKEEVEDIWADRVDDLPPIKPIKFKLKTMETTENSYIAPQVEESSEKTLPKPETIHTIEFNTSTLRYQIHEITQPQKASMYFEEEETKLQQKEIESEDVDFWAQIEKARESKTAEPSHATANTDTFIDSFGEPEISMYNDDNILQTELSILDPLKYPEEPREVDTDEEIDFWAEIEANKESDEDDVTFHKSASFWASMERENSVDKTPYKPILPKAFRTKLIDPPTEDLSVLEVLEAHKGEEPIIIDPTEVEEKVIANEYDDMMENNTEVDSIADKSSVYEPVLSSVWCPLTQTQEPMDTQEPAMDCCTQIEQQQPFVAEHEMEIEEEKEDAETKPEKDILEIKRNNYKKAFAFFCTPIDENKGQTVDHHERSKSKSSHNSFIVDDSEKWDWDAVNEALQQDNNETSKKLTINETFDKELTPQFVTPPLQTTKNETTPLSEDYVKPKLKCFSNDLHNLEVSKVNEDKKISVKDRISAFEGGTVEQKSNQSLSVENSNRQSSLSRNNSTQRSESEMDEDDSGVTDMNKQLSETDTESESFPELRKMSSYQRAATHSRLFKLLQEDADLMDASQKIVEFQSKPSRKKIVHNVSITRKQNPNALAEAETMSQRRERLSLPLCQNISIDADNPSTPNSPASPITGQTANKSSIVSDKLVSELVQSLLLKSNSTHFKNLPMEKLQAAAKRVLEEELDSLENTSVDSTPAMTPNDVKKDKSYADYYNTWSDALGAEQIVPSKTFRALQDNRRSPWTARCPRVLSSKTMNWDLSRVTESPEISMRTSKSPECFKQSRESSVGKWKKL